jgi:hypothetical protein
MDWPDDGFTARPPAWVLDHLDPPDSIDATDP